MFDNERKIITAQRLKDLRSKKNLSHEKLRDELKKINIDVSVGSLKAYEVTDIYHSKFHATKGMSIETLYGLAEFYNVSADYLLGLSDIKSSDTNLKSFSKYTKLNEMAITALKQNNEDNMQNIYIINSLIGNGTFHHLVNVLSEIGKAKTEYQQECGKYKLMELMVHLADNFIEK